MIYSATFTLIVVQILKNTLFLSPMNKLKHTYIILLAISMMLIGCTKPDNGEPFITTPEFSKILFVNVLSEDAQFPVSFYIDQINRTPVLVEFGQPSEMYVSLSGRTHDFGVKRGDDFILQENIKVGENKLYTLYLTGTRALPQFVLLEDDVTISPNTAGCSFVHMAPQLGKSKIQNHYPAEPYFGWVDTDTLIVDKLNASPIGKPYYGSSRRFYGAHAEELSDILVRATNDKGDIPFTNNNSVRMPLSIDRYGSLVLYPDTTQTTGYNLLSFDITEKL